MNSVHTLVLSIRFPERSASQNVVNSMGRRERMRWKKRWRDDTALLCLQRRGWAKATEKRFVRVTRYTTSGGGLDFENFTGGCKPIFDGLVSCGALVDDSLKWCDPEYAQAFSGNGTFVEVFEIGGDDELP